MDGACTHQEITKFFSFLLHMNLLFWDEQNVNWLKLEINRQENASYIPNALVLIIVWPSPNLVPAVFKKQNIWKW
jgi:hypothetical protein